MVAVVAHVIRIFVEDRHGRGSLCKRGGVSHRRHVWCMNLT